MFPGSVVSGGLSMGKVIGGISKTLNVANQIIPLYQQAKPLFGNAKNAFNLLKSFNSSSTNNKNKLNITNNSTLENLEKKETIIQTVSNNPVFFL